MSVVTSTQDGASKASKSSVATRPRNTRWALPVAATIAVLAVAQLVIGLGVGTFSAFPTPTAVIAKMFELLGDGAIWTAIGQTLWSSFLGLVIAVSLAVPIGILIATSKIAYYSTNVVIEFLRPIPPITFVPVAILLFGTSIKMKLVLVVFGCFWLLLLQTYYGVRAVEPTLRDVTSAYRFSRAQKLRHLLLPTAAPYVATGLRLAATFAVGLSIVAELVGGARGIGFVIYQYQISDQRTAMFAIVVIAALLGMAIEAAMRFFESRVLSWHESYRKVEK